MTITRKTNFMKPWTVWTVKDIKILIDDMNAKVGKEDRYGRHIGKFSIHQHINISEDRLVNFAASKGMIVVGSNGTPRTYI